MAGGLARARPSVWAWRAPVAQLEFARRRRRPNRGGDGGASNNKLGLAEIICKRQARATARPLVQKWPPGARVRANTPGKLVWVHTAFCFIHLTGRPHLVCFKATTGNIRARLYGANSSGKSDI